LPRLSIEDEDDDAAERNRAFIAAYRNKRGAS
jgi:hypothetical protein